MQGGTLAICRSTTIVALLVALALPASAGARDVVTNGTLHYSSRTQQIPANLGGASAAAVCPEGRYAISGGFESDVEQDFFNIAASTPLSPAFPFPDLHNWSVSFVSATAAPRNITVRAVCADEKPEYVKNKKQVGPHKRGTASVECPGNRHVYGGGGSGAILASSFPIDSDDPNGKPDDGWKVSMDNFGSSGKAKITVIAACGKTMPDYNHHTVNVTPTSGTTAAQGCGETPAAIGGGHRIGGGLDEGFLTQSIVSNPDTFNEFSATMTNDASHDLQFTAYSICGDPSDFG